MNKTKLFFLGGAGTVTGSKTLLEHGNFKVMVDCGLFQGLKNLRELNRAKLPVDPTKIDALVLSHAHLDHSGYIPVLVKNGFSGPIHCTSATLELTKIILKDSAKIQEEDAERANRYGYSKHPVATPLYTQKDVSKALELFVEHDFNEWVILNNDISFEFLNSGHILGSGFVNFKVADKKIVFSGDIGREKPLLLYPPKRIKEADYLVLESTYGDRLHGEEDVKVKLAQIIQETYDKRGILMIPSFAVERTQELLYLIYQLREEGKLPNMPVYLDSPMGVNSTNVYDRYHELQNISRYELQRVYDDVKFVSDPIESKEVCFDTKPKIVLAGSGMIEGGRIIHYLNNHMSNKKNTLLFVGYQGEGTRGRAILKGSPEIKFFGEYHPVKCDIRSISSLSAHGDRKDIMEWLGKFNKLPKTIFINHGESHQADALRSKIEFELKVPCEVPQFYEEFILED